MRFALGAPPEPGGHREGERMIHAARVEKRLLRVLPAALLLVLSAGCSMGTPEGSPSPVVPMVKVKFVVRNGQTMQEIPSDGWTARIELPQDSSAAVIAASTLVRKADKSTGIAGPIPAGTYLVVIEAPGYQRLIRKTTFKVGVDNKIDAALDPLPAE